MTYKEEIIKAMEFLVRDERVIFLGQSVRYPGNLLYETLKTIPDSRKIEMPIAEDMQMGMSIGLSLEGFIPVTCYPRMDFLLLALNQLVNHLDKIGEMSQWQFKPKVIIRTLVGARAPLYPGPQHCQDHTDAIKKMLFNITVAKINRAEMIIPWYKMALNSESSTIIVEMSELYGMAEERNLLAEEGVR